MLEKYVQPAIDLALIIAAGAAAISFYGYWRTTGEEPYLTWFAIFGLASLIIVYLFEFAIRFGLTDFVPAKKLMVNFFAVCLLPGASVVLFLDGYQQYAIWPLALFFGIAIGGIIWVKVLNWPLFGEVDDHAEQ